MSAPPIHEALPADTAAADAAPAVSVPGRRRSLLQALLSEPSRFSFDAAAAVLRRASAGAIRFQATPGLGFVPSDVLAVKRSGAGFAVITGLLGLTGPGGVLPRPYTEAVNAAQRRRSPALAAFFDMVAQRFLGAFAGAAVKYRPHLAAGAAVAGGQADDGLRNSLLALTGHRPEHSLGRASPGAEPLLFYAGAFAARPRSADRLAALLSDWLGPAVEVEQFVGAWLELGRDQMTALPTSGWAGQYNQLGVDAAVGARAWDIQSRIMLRIGPLGFDQFQALLPGRELLRRLSSLAHAYLDGETGFAINPVLAAHAVPELTLGPASPCLLGWTSWLPVSGTRHGDAGDAVFAAHNDQTDTGKP